MWRPGTVSGRSFTGADGYQRFVLDSDWGEGHGVTYRSLWWVVGDEYARQMVTRRHAVAEVHEYVTGVARYRRYRVEVRLNDSLVWEQDGYEQRSLAMHAAYQRAMSEVRA